MEDSRSYTQPQERCFLQTWSQDLLGNHKNFVSQPSIHCEYVTLNGGIVGAVECTFKYTNISVQEKIMRGCNIILLIINKTTLIWIVFFCSHGNVQLGFRVYSVCTLLVHIWCYVLLRTCFNGGFMHTNLIAIIHKLSLTLGLFLMVQVARWATTQFVSIVRLHLHRCIRAQVLAIGDSNVLGNGCSHPILFRICIQCDISRINEKLLRLVVCIYILIVQIRKWQNIDSIEVSCYINT